MPRKTDLVLVRAERGTITSDVVSSLLNISKNHAANILNSLTVKHGHLKRNQKNLKKGYRYEYSITKYGINRLKWLRKHGRLEE